MLELASLKFWAGKSWRRHLLEETAVAVVVGKLQQGG